MEPMDEAQVIARLFDLARVGAVDELADYLDAGAPVDLRDAEGNTLVLLAAYHEHPVTVRELTTRGADVNLGNDKGQTPLSGAVYKNNLPVINELLEAGASPTLGVPSALQTAQYFGRADLMELLLAHAQPGPDASDNSGSAR